MKNVTIALDDEVHRKARIRAAELGTSLSALVKDYLIRLTGEGAPVPGGVHEMPAPFTHAPAAKADGPPWFVDGQWVYTKDGKPRQPGSMRHLPPLPDDWDEWPEGFWDFLDDPVEPRSDLLKFDEQQLPKP